jgi:hypothetical protein
MISKSANRGKSNFRFYLKIKNIKYKKFKLQILSDVWKMLWS